MAIKLLTDEELNKITGGTGNSSVDNKALGKCLLDNGASLIPILAPAVIAIISKDWSKFSSEMKRVEIKALPIVQNCYTKVKNND